MPLDTCIVADELAELGITPVARAKLTDHKRHMIETHRGASCQWLTYTLDADHLTQQLGRINRLPLSLPRWASAPRRVRTLAETVHTALPNAVFSLGYFYRDPYLMVLYRGNYACLAIWRHRFNLVAIATRR